MCCAHKNFPRLFLMFYNLAVPPVSDTDAPTERTHLFYANCQKMSIHISQIIVKTTVLKINMKAARANPRSLLRTFVRKYMSIPNRTESVRPAGARIAGCPLGIDKERQQPGNHE